MNEFDLDVTEYKEIALIAKNNQYYPVIENGTVLDEKVANPTKISLSWKSSKTLQKSKN